MAEESPPFDQDAQEATRTHHDQTSMEPRAHSAPVPEIVDGYRILRLLGQGGMGFVYEAEQQEPRRRVALKVVRGSAQTDDLQMRLFRREVETLARLRHPNIAAIFGSGRLPDGRPYFAMELVEGPTLDVYLRRRPSPANRSELVHRLSLMRKISEAVHYAHQRGVIHRDLKPSNIVVTEEFGTKSAVTGAPPLPEVKILDFGLARITDADAGATLLSDAGTIRGTLPYMSPEQARGQIEEIDVRSDVYALGIILYEMLAGERPYDVHRAALAEALRVICEEPPRPLSKTASGMRRADSDLQTIVLKALAKEADRRYASASAMAEDLERYLTSQPILARPPSAAYLVRKLVQRHRPLFAALTIVLAAIAGASVLSTSMYLRARTEAAKSEQVAAFLGDMLTGVGPSVARGRDTAMLREILDRTAKRVTGELGGQPEAAAGIEQVLGETYQQLGELEPAEDHLNAALAVHRSLHRRGEPDVAEDLRGLGTVKWNHGELAPAESLFKEVVAMRRRLHPGPNAKLAEAETDLGNVLAQAGRYDEAEPLLREALAMDRQVLGDENGRVAVDLNSLADLMQYRGAYDQADTLYRAALAMHRKLLGEDHPDVSVDVTNLGYLEMNKSNLAAAESLFAEAVAINKRIYNGDHPSVAAGITALGKVQKRRGDWAAAEASFREVLEMNKRLHGDGTAPVADAMNDLAVVIGERQGADAAIAMQREALAIHRRVLAKDDPAVATDLANLAYSLTSQGQYDEAEALYKEALADYVAARGEDHPTVLLIENNLARLYQNKGDLDAAEALFRKVLDGRRRALGEKNDQVAITMTDIASVLRDRERLDEAEKMQADALALLNETVGPQHPATMVAHTSHGRLLCDLGRFAEAEPELRASRDSLAAIYGPGHARTLVADMNLARATAARGEDREAETLFKTVVESPQDAIPPSMMAEARRHSGEFLTRTRRFGEAETQLLGAEKALRNPRGGAVRARDFVIGDLIDLYEKWAAAEPGAGKSEQAKRWRAARELAAE